MGGRVEVEEGNSGRWWVAGCVRSREFIRGTLERGTGQESPTPSQFGALANPLRPAETHASAPPSSSESESGDEAFPPHPPGEPRFPGAFVHFRHSRAHTVQLSIRWRSSRTERLSPGEPQKAPRRFCFPSTIAATGYFPASCISVEDPAQIYRTNLAIPDIERVARLHGALFGVPGRRVSPGWHYFDCRGVISRMPRPNSQVYDLRRIS